MLTVSSLKIELHSHFRIFWWMVRSAVNRSAGYGWLAATRVVSWWAHRANRIKWHWQCSLRVCLRKCSWTTSAYWWSSNQLLVGDEKPFSVLNIGVFLDIFILFSSGWLPKSDCKYSANAAKAQPDDWPVKSDMQSGQHAVDRVLRKKPANALTVWGGRHTCLSERRRSLLLHVLLIPPLNSDGYRQSFVGH